MKALVSALRCLLLLSASFVVVTALAESSPVATMATIVEELNHFPGDEQKATLREIADDENNSEAVQAIATAIHGMEHKIGGDDAARLEAIAADDANDEDVRTLAAVVLGVEHKAGDDAVETLRSLQ